jgi:hypothetical protein
MSIMETGQGGFNLDGSAFGWLYGASQYSGIFTCGFLMLPLPLSLPPPLRRARDLAGAEATGAVGPWIGRHRDFSRRKMASRVREVRCEMWSGWPERKSAGLGGGFVAMDVVIILHRLALRSCTTHAVCGYREGRTVLFRRFRAVDARLDARWHFYAM